MDYPVYVAAKFRHIKKQYNCQDSCPSFSNIEDFQTINKGIGIRATNNISQKTYIGCYYGKICRNNQIKNKFYTFDYEYNNLVVDGDLNCLMSYLNHSSKPNCYAVCEMHKVNEIYELHITIKTNKDIIKGEELTIDYGEDYWKNMWKKYRIKPSLKQTLITDFF